MKRSQILRNAICLLVVFLMISGSKAYAAVIEDGNTTIVQELFLNGYAEVHVESKDEAKDVCHEAQAYIDAMSVSSETRKVTGKYLKNSNTLKLTLEESKAEDFSEDELVSFYENAGLTVESINNFIVNKLSYDREAANNAESLALSSSPATARGALFNGKAICQGYSNLFSIAAEHAGIENIKVRGRINGAYHVLNVVRTENGTILAVDVTSNDSTGQNWAITEFESYCKILGFEPEIDVEAAFVLKYPD